MRVILKVFDASCGEAEIQFAVIDVTPELIGKLRRMVRVSSAAKNTHPDLGAFEVRFENPCEVGWFGELGFEEGDFEATEALYDQGIAVLDDRLSPDDEQTNDVEDEQVGVDSNGYVSFHCRTLFRQSESNYHTAGVAVHTFQDLLEKHTQTQSTP